jgi:hypothetical protein
MQATSCQLSRQLVVLKGHQKQGPSHYYTRQDKFQWTRDTEKCLKINCHIEAELLWEKHKIYGENNHTSTGEWWQSKLPHILSLLIWLKTDGMVPVISLMSNHTAARVRGQLWGRRVGRGGNKHAWNLLKLIRRDMSGMVPMSLLS